VTQAPYQGLYVLPPDVEWMRHGDKVTFDWTKFALTRTWQGAPGWDHLIYPVG
jgi:hypothetical protein